MLFISIDGARHTKSHQAFIQADTIFSSHEASNHLLNSASFHSMFSAARPFSHQQSINQKKI